MRTPLGCFILVLSPLELTLFTAWDLFLPFSVFITVTKNSLIAIYYCCTGKAALVCLPCWGFALHLREKCSISVSSMASRWLVPRLWFFFWQQIQATSTNVCIINIFQLSVLGGWEMNGLFSSRSSLAEKWCRVVLAHQHCPPTPPHAQANDRRRK